jgi:hypothetical protein
MPCAANHFALQSQVDSVPSLLPNLYLLDGLVSTISVTQNEQLAGRNSEALFDRGW